MWLKYDGVPPLCNFNAIPNTIHGIGMSQVTNSGEHLTNLELRITHVF
jgi:hypothetical protein